MPGLSQHTVSWHGGKVQVEQDTVEGISLKHLQGYRAIVRTTHGIAVQLQTVTEHPRLIGIIFDD